MLSHKRSILSSLTAALTALESAMEATRRASRATVEYNGSIETKVFVIAAINHSVVTTQAAAESVRSAYLAIISLGDKDEHRDTS